MRVAQEGVQHFLYFSKNQQEMSAFLFVCLLILNVSCATVVLHVLSGCRKAWPTSMKLMKEVGSYLLSHYLPWIILGD